MAVTTRKPPKTWSLLGEVRRRPSVYEATAAKFNYHFRREPAPFEMDPTAAINQWYLEHREGSPFNVEDWEGFRDPAKLTYSDYVSTQHDRETYLDLLIDHHEAAGSIAKLDKAWVDTLTALLVPLRFPLHVLQMTGLYVAQMAPSAFIINCSNFQAADEMRRIQRLAYLTRLLANEHGDTIAATDTAREPWQSGEAWQPLREVS
jgi:toluene monooxygenase system protein E